MRRFLAPVLMSCAMTMAGCTFNLTSPEPAQAAAPAACGSGDLSCTGRVLAEIRCARCHAIGATGTSPYPGAQPFRAFWRRWTRSALADALKTGIIVEHDRSEVKLPEMKLEEAEIKALFAYLDTVQEQ